LIARPAPVNVSWYPRGVPVTSILKPAKTAFDKRKSLCYFWKTGYVTGFLDNVLFYRAWENMNRRSSIHDVALKAGVSKATVSHVINGTRFVEEETKNRVLQAIEELSYRPSLAARSLTTNRTQTIGIVVSDVSNSFFAEVLKGIENVFLSKNYSLILCNTNETLERERLYLDLLLSQKVDGVIAAATSQQWDVLETAALRHLPMVFVDRKFEGFQQQAYVGADNRGGAYLGTQYLIERGYREIGILAGFERLSSMRERYEGFRQALHDHNIPLREDWVIASPLSIQAGYEAARHILTLPNRPRALFLNNNFLNLGTLMAVNDLGLRCPQDIALVGFDDHSWAAVASPPLTVVRQPAQEIGRIAAEMLFTIINGGELENPHVTLPCEVIIRQST
jgi:LacI family transcriptional regulator